MNEITIIKLRETDTLPEEAMSGIAILCFTARWSKLSLDSVDIIAGEMRASDLDVPIIVIDIDTCPSIARLNSISDLPRIHITNDGKLILGIDEIIDYKLANGILNYIKGEMYD